VTPTSSENTLKGRQLYDVFEPHPVGLTGSPKFWRAVSLLYIVANSSLSEKMSSSRSPSADTLTRNTSGPDFVL
jgi:hypothetical protein